MLIVSILDHTPFWVWLLLAFLLYRGVAAMRPREVSPSRALIVPVIFFVWGVASLVGPLIGGVFADAGVWRKRWRLFFLATAGLFGHARGAEWGVSHYRLRPA